jgi:hypothetical protein
LGGADVREWTIPFTAVVIVTIVTVLAMYLITDSEATEKILLGYMDSIIAFVVATVPGGFIGRMYGYQFFHRNTDQRRLKDLTNPTVIAYALTLAALVAVFWKADTATQQDEILSNLNVVVAALFGTGTSGAVAAVRGYNLASRE